MKQNCIPVFLVCLAGTQLASSQEQESRTGGGDSSGAAATNPAPSPAITLDEIVVLGRETSLIGVAGSANQGIVGASQLATRPTLRPGEVLETVPGLIITQHSGSGKANQFFLRGFNLDHGTDLATFLEGVPVNLPSHGHGQGYTDLNFLIPELVRTVEFRKGPYFAEVGDFGSAGDVRLSYLGELPQSIFRVEGGTFGFQRGLAASSTPLWRGKLLYAAEAQHSDGPWSDPDNFVKFNGLLKYSGGTADAGWSLTGMAYHGEWNSTDQVARRAVDQGLISRLDSLDDSDRGDSQRYSAAGELHVGDDAAMTRARIYHFYYDLDLYSNFTYFLDDPVNGDQFEQKDRRYVSGLDVSHQRTGQFWGGREVTNTLGFQVRNDFIQNGLFHTLEARRIGTTRRDTILETSFGPYAEHATRWTPWLRSSVGIRGDLFHFDVDSDRSINSGEELAFRPSPRAGVVLGPWAETEIYLNAGYGLHSNDARGVRSRLDPKTGDPVRGADPLVQTRGAEVGVRTGAVDGLQSTLSLWALDSDSELLFVGDAGTTEAGRPSRRVGIELASYYEILEWLALDLDVAFSRARFRDTEPEGDHIPGAVESVVAAGLAVKDFHNFFGSLRLRYFGPRPLVEDNTVRASRTTLVNAQLGYHFSEHWDASVEIFNLLNSKDNDIEYFYTSRLQGEPAGGIDDRHFHPVEPISFRFSLTGRF